MLNLPKSFILFDTEYTAWDGSQARKWSGPNEHKEIVQIGAIKIENEKLVETERYFVFIKPKLNPQLSDYFISLTGITQEIVDKNSVDFSSALVKFKKWCGELPVYSFGRDEEIIKENCALVEVSFPFLISQFYDIQDIFKLNGVATERYASGTIVEAFGKKPFRKGHDGLDDARTILDGLIELDKKITS
ncbi:MAG: 3'-5' exonuclease [bacterium]|nr:3'-5' exonuclease [bacterium]